MTTSENVFKDGQIVKIVSRETPTGLPKYMGKGRIVKKLGTVPDFYMVEYLEGGLAGRQQRLFVHAEDQ